MTERKTFPFVPVLAVLVALGAFLVVTSWACNEAVCASIVSKCTLTQACRCELKNCTCCKECFDCLTYLYDECCSCVGKQNSVMKKCSMTEFCLFVQSFVPSPT